MKTQTDPFYQSTRWKHLREAILRRDGYRCQIAKRTKLIPVEATIVHHIFPREIFPEYQWEPWNLISLSMAEHNRMHDRNTDQLTGAGKTLLFKTARKRGMDLEEIKKRIGGGE